jgi:hypothetical protein
MNTSGLRRSLFCVAAAAIALSAAASSAAALEAPERRCAQQETGIDTVAHGSPSRLELIRRACPLLAGIVETFVLQDLGEAAPEASFPSRAKSRWSRHPPRRGISSQRGFLQSEHLRPAERGSTWKSSFISPQSTPGSPKPLKQRARFLTC